LLKYISSSEETQWSWELPTLLEDERIYKECKNDRCDYFAKFLIDGEVDWDESPYYPWLSYENGERDFHLSDRIKIKKLDGEYFLIFKMSKDREDKAKPLEKGRLHLRFLQI